MNENDIERRLKEEMEKFDAKEPSYLRTIAITDGFTSGYSREFEEVIGEVSSDEDVILEFKHFKTETEAREWANEWIKRLCDEGKQEEFSVHIEWTEKNTRTVFDCSSYRKLKAKRREINESSIREKIIQETNRQKRIDRWQEACLWASKNGIRVRKEKDGSIGHNKRVTIVDKIIKANLVKQFNDEFPEFAISDEYLRFNYKKVRA